MADLALAMNEKQTEEHRVIDEAYADRADVSVVFNAVVRFFFFCMLTSRSGLHGLFHSSRRPLPAFREQTQERQDEELSRKSEARRDFRLDREGGGQCARTFVVQRESAQT
jgi:hypothetical protein